MSFAERTPDLLDLVGLGIQGAADDQEDALGIQPHRFIVQGLRRSFAVNDTVDRRKIVYPCFAHLRSPCELSSTDLQAATVSRICRDAVSRKA